MAAITSQTFHHTPALSIRGGAHLAAGVLASGARLLKHLLLAQPKAAAHRARIEEAEATRRLADGWLETDPGFAADLYAAAARHEAQDLR